MSKRKTRKERKQEPTPFELTPTEDILEMVRQANAVYEASIAAKPLTPEEEAAIDRMMRKSADDVVVSSPSPWQPPPAKKKA
jgi:hypothetical protein